MLLELFGQEVPPRNLQLLLVRITGQLNNLHPVQQRPGDRAGCISCGDKQDLAQVHRNLQEMISESVVLLTVQHLQHSGGGVAPKVIAHLVNFVEQQ